MLQVSASSPINKPSSEAAKSAASFSHDILPYAEQSSTDNHSLIREVLELLINLVSWRFVSLRLDRATGEFHIKVGDVNVRTQLGNEGCFDLLVAYCLPV